MVGECGRERVGESAQRGHRFRREIDRAVVERLDPCAREREGLEVCGDIPHDAEVRRSNRGRHPRPKQRHVGRDTGLVHPCPPASDQPVEIREGDVERRLHLAQPARSVLVPRRLQP